MFRKMIGIVLANVAGGVMTLGWTHHHSTIFPQATSGDFLVAGFVILFIAALINAVA